MHDRLAHLVTFSIVLGLSLTFTASSAHAVDISVLRLSSTSGTAPLSVGDLVTIDVVLSNTDGVTDLLAVGIDAAFYDESVADVVSAEASTRFFNTAQLPDGTPVGGFGNTSAIGEIFGPNGTSVRLFRGASLSPIDGDGSLDLGVGGVPIASGGAHARVVFQITGPGLTQVVFTGDQAGAGVVTFPGTLSDVSAPNGATVILGTGVVVPEPGAALLIGLGLAWMAGDRARSRPA